MLDHEKKIKVYQIKNLNEHINKFINIQESPATKENYNILLENFYNYAMENELKEINITNATNIIKEYKANWQVQALTIIYYGCKVFLII